MNNKDTTTESETSGQMKVFLPNKLLECLPRTPTLPKERLHWNTNEEIASFLISFDRHDEWLSCTLKTRPQNGSVILYNRKKVKYRKDGYCWKKRKDGKTTREDHMKLKVQGMECLYGCYVHSSIVPTFHRRCYWLLQNPDIVLVHYLNVPSLEDSVKSCGPVSSALTDRRDSLRWSRDELLSQLKPMFNSIKWSCGGNSSVELSVEQMVQQILETQQTKPQPRTHTCLCASPGSNIPHRCNSTKHRIISPKLPTSHPALSELLNLANEGSEVGREAGPGDALVAVVPSERKQPEEGGRGDDLGGVASPCSTSSSSSSSPPQTQQAATIALSNGNGFYGDQRGGLAALIVMTTAAPVGRGCGEEPNAELGSTHLSLTRAGGRLVISPVPPKQDTPSLPSSTSPQSPAPPNQGVATLSLTLLPSPVIGGLLLTDTPGTLLPPNPTSPSPLLLPFDPESFLNSPKQGQTYGGPALTPHSLSASSSPSPPPSTSPQPPSLALSLSPTSPPSSLSSLSSETERKSIPGCPSPSLSLSLSPARTIPTLLPLCLELSLGLDSMSSPLSVPPSDDRAPPTGFAAQAPLGHLLTNLLSPATQITPSLEVLPTNQLPPEGEKAESQHSMCIHPPNRLSVVQGGVKLLITGPWSETDSRYSCVFDQSRVPASLIQPGVLRCYCPAHEAGLVALHVLKDSSAVSSSVLFEYRARNASSLPSSQLDWLSLDDNQFRMSILERLEQMERRMAEMSNNNQQNQHMNHYHQQLSRNQSSAPHLTPENQVRTHTLTLIHAHIRWRSISVNSLDLEQEVDPLNVDHFSCTPLMWACALGHQAAAVLLYRWSSAALGIPDSLGRLPLAVAHSRGHTRLARCLEELHTHSQTQEHTPDTPSPPYRPLSPLSCSPDTGLSSSSSVPSPSDLPSPSPSSAYSSGSVTDPIDSASSPFSAPPPAGSTDSLFLMDCEASSPSAPAVLLHSELADELLSYSENAENEDYLCDEVLQVDMATLTEQIIEATPERIKREEFSREAESPLRERRDNPAIHDTMPWLATYLDTVDRGLCPTPPSLLSDLALQRLRPPSSVAWAEFLNASANGRMERDFALLTLTDTEQRELYEAARIIQNAFRRYKGRRLKEQQDMAAAVIQRCYRKYKQLTWIALKYALYKKMTQAAILIQSKFRSYYEQKKFQQSRRAAVLIQQYYRSYKEYERVKQGPRGPGALNTRLKGSFLTKKQDQAARKIMRFLRRCRHRYTSLTRVSIPHRSNSSQSLSTRV
ncbi:calmodulin-binding transcription activator 2 [Sinocyclocheilus grahami]|uniref:calmodulin-binding transcription activator 2 n=1 Tax=Sinocyclocheilus grahami TaxID=75366 RepID=UPI0007AD4155|nr:PREDICTED: calmodulin-binding transcription activator 2 [Sinocyclocheilus grahami]